MGEKKNGKTGRISSLQLTLLVQVWVANRKQRGQTILLSTHIIPYAAELCERAIFINNGNIQEISEWMSWSYDEKMKQVKRMVEQA